MSRNGTKDAIFGVGILIVGVYDDVGTVGMETEIDIAGTQNHATKDGIKTGMDDERFHCGIRIKIGIVVATIVRGLCQGNNEGADHGRLARINVAHHVLHIECQVLIVLRDDTIVIVCIIVGGETSSILVSSSVADRWVTSCFGWVVVIYVMCIGYCCWILIFFHPVVVVVIIIT